MIAPAQRSTLLLWGMSGTGKTSAAHQLAALRGVPAVDLDARIVAAAGSSIAAIFGERGEAAFRSLEDQQLERLLAEQHAGPRVVALGGGALLAAPARARALQSCFVVVLHAPLAVLELRHAGSNDRPLLNMGPLPDRLRTLLAARSHAYAEGHLHLDSGQHYPIAIARQIAAAWSPLGPGP